MNESGDFTHPEDMVAFASSLMLTTQVGVSAPNAQLAGYLKTGMQTPTHAVGLSIHYRKVSCPIGCDHPQDPIVLTNDQAGALAGMLEAWANLLPDGEYAEYTKVSEDARRQWDGNFRKKHGNTLP